MRGTGLEALLLFLGVIVLATFVKVAISMVREKKPWGCWVVFIFFLLLFARACGGVHFATPYAGKVIDSSTGQPLHDALVVRSWRTRIGSPGGESGGQRIGTSTRLTNKDGEFCFWPRIIPYFSLSLPPLTFSFSKECNLIVCKPGYTIYIHGNAKVIKLEKIPDSPYVRIPEAKNMEGQTCNVAWSRKKFFKELSEEIELARNFSGYQRGVFYVNGDLSSMDLITDMAIGGDNRAYLLTEKSAGVEVVSKSTERLGSIKIASPAYYGGVFKKDATVKPSHIIQDTHGNLYLFTGGSWVGVLEISSDRVLELRQGRKVFFGFRPGMVAICPDRELFVAEEQNRGYFSSSHKILFCNFNGEKAGELAITKDDDFAIIDIEGARSGQVALLYKTGAYGQKFGVFLVEIDQNGKNATIVRDKEFSFSSFGAQKIGFVDGKIVVLLSNTFRGDPRIYTASLLLLNENLEKEGLEGLEGLGLDKKVLGIMEIENFYCDRAAGDIYLLDQEFPRIFKVRLPQ